MELESIIKVEVVKGASGRSEVMDSDMVSASASLSTGSRHEEEAIERQSGRSPKRNLGMPVMVPPLKVEAVDEGATDSSGVLNSDTLSTGVSTGRAHTEDIPIVEDGGRSSKAHLIMAGMRSSSSIKVEAEEETTGTGSSEGYSGRDQRCTEVRTTQREKKVGRSKNTASREVSESETLSTIVSTGCGGPDHTSEEGGRSSKTDLGMPGMVSEIKVEHVKGAAGTSKVVDSNTVSTNVSIARRHEEEKVEESGQIPKGNLGNQSVKAEVVEGTVAGRSEGHLDVAQLSSEVRTTQRRQTKVGKGKKAKRNVSQSSSALQRRRPQCVFCEKTFCSTQRLDTHLRLSIGESAGGQRMQRSVCVTSTPKEPHFCPHCRKSFPLKSNLTRHLRVHSAGKFPKRYSCDQCGKSFGFSWNLIQHRTVHSGERRFACSICSRKFRASNNLKSHMRTHTQEKPFPCDICDKGFATLGQLNTHIRTHTKEKPFICVMCGKGFAQDSTLMTHIMSHTQEKPYFCKLCEREFKLAVNLRNHLRSHTQERPFKCEICSKGFYQRVFLDSHMRSHTKEKPFSCVMCGTGFSQSSSLMHHIRMHTQERPYFCRVCKKEFRSSSYMTKHSRIHTPSVERPFSCEICSKGFKERVELYSHMRTHTKEKPYNCGQCRKTFAYQSNLRYHKKKLHPT